MIRRLPLLALAIGTMALAACGGGNDEPDPNAPCESHADCAGNPNGEWCSDDSRCVECAATLHCDDGLLCDLTDNTCVGCRDNLDCAGDVCDPETRTCVQCLADNDCGVWSLCDTDTKTCNDLCATDADCAGSEEGPACDRTTGACVPCIGDGHCPAGEKCDLNDHTCYAAPNDMCETVLDCLGDDSGVVCDAETGHCVDCLEDADCGDTGSCVAGRCESGVSCQSDSWCTDSVCDEAAGQCTGCLEDADCTYWEAAPFCNATLQRCVQCRTDTDCSEGFCETATGTCQACASDDNCTDPLQPSCVVNWGLVCGCSGDEACEDPSAPYCKSGSTCVECLADEHCTDEALPACHPGTGNCVECMDDSQCTDPAAPSCWAEVGSCVECTSMFDCTDPAASTCVLGPDDLPVCGTNDVCTTDDEGDPNDDGFSGATDLTPETGDLTTLTRKICGGPAGAETDWYKFTVADGDAATLTLTWSDGSDMGVVVYEEIEVDGQKNLAALGQNAPVQPAEVRLTYLPAGTYYAVVQRYDAQDATEAVRVAPSDYELSFTRTAGQCESAADCAAEFETQYFRGACNATTGACEEIDGQGTLAAGEVCDSADDCASQRCGYGWSEGGFFVPPSYGLFFKSADTRATCAAAGCASDADCGGEDVCLVPSPFSEGWCLPPCTEDAECPLYFGAEPVDGWPRMTCNVGSGKCEMPQ